jgi:transcriptional regulator
MKVLKDTWERAPKGPQKDAALKSYETAQACNIARIEKAAMNHLRKAEAALK